MTSVKVCVFVALVTLCGGSPTKKAFWKGTSFDSSVEEMRALCAEDDPIACLKFKALSFLDSLLQKDNFQVTSLIFLIFCKNDYCFSRLVMMWKFHETLTMEMK